MDNSSYRSERPPHRNNSANNPQRPQYQNQDQYISRQPAITSEVPYRSEEDDYQGPRPYYNGSNNPYSGGSRFPFQPRPFFNSTYQSNINQPQQPYQPRQQQPLAGRPPLQITNGNASQSPDQRTFSNQDQTPKSDAKNFNRNPFRRPAVFFAVKAYHAEDSETPVNNQEKYQQYENAFYQSTSAEDFQNQSAKDFSEQPSESKEYQNKSVETHFIARPTTLTQTITCRLYKTIFPSNNILHKHLVTCRKPSADYHNTATKPNADPTTHASSYQIIESTAKDQLTPNRAFRGYRFATVNISLTYQDQLYKYCFDTDCTISLIDQAFFNQILKKANDKLQIDIKRTSPIRIRDLGTKKHNACEYTIIPIYIPDSDSNKIALIRRKIHIVNNLSAKTLIDIDIIKSEEIVLDIDRDFATIESYNSLQISMSIMAKGPRTDTVIISKARFAIPAHSLLTIPIKQVDLPPDRDLIFESEQLDTLTLSAHLVDHTLSQVLIRNDTDLPITLSRHTRLSKVLEYKTEKCYPVQINIKNAPLADKSFKKAKTRSFIKQAFRKLLKLTAAFDTVTSASIETIHHTDTTIYGDASVTQAIAVVADSFPNLWKNTGNVTNIPEDQ